MKGCRRGWRVQRGSSLTETEADPSGDDGGGGDGGGVAAIVLVGRREGVLKKATVVAVPLRRGLCGRREEKKGG